MGKKAALFDTEEFDIKEELKNENIEVKQVNTKQPEVLPVQKLSEPEAKPKYLRLDLKDNSHSYISFMADIEKISMTQYINNLIDSDKINNKDAYNKFLEIENIKNNI